MEWKLKQIYRCTVFKSVSSLTSIFRCIDRKCTPSSARLSLSLWLSLSLPPSYGFLSWRAPMRGCDWLPVFTTSSETKTERSAGRGRACTKCRYVLNVCFDTVISLYMSIEPQCEKTEECWQEVEETAGIWKHLKVDARSRLSGTKKSEIWAVTTNHCLQQNPAKVCT